MKLRKYASIMRGGFCEGYAFRKQLFSSMLANFIQLLALFFVWKSIFQHQDVVGGYTWDTMKQYVFVSYLCNSTFSFGFETEMSKKIIKGDIIIDLLKPISYKTMMFCRMLGSAVIEFIITLVITGSLFLALNGIPDI